MPDRVGSDHPSVTTHRGTLVRRGGTRRPAVAVPGAGGDLPTESAPVRLVIDGRERRAPVVPRDGSPTIAGAYDNVRLARERAGTDRLAAWVEAESTGFGRSVLVDVVEPGELFGLRIPGSRTVYEAADGPSADLRRIAEDLDP